MRHGLLIRARLFGLIVGLSITLAACTGLPTRSFISPTLSDRSYDGFIVYAAFSDLAVAGAFEQTMCRTLQNNAHACERMLSVAPPTQTQNSGSRQQAMQNSGARAALIIELADPNTISRRILANGQPGYRVSLVDIEHQTIVARITVDGRSAPRSLDDRAQDVSQAIVRVLKHRHLLAEYP